jgi:hypothetical protein
MKNSALIIEELELPFVLRGARGTTHRAVYRKTRYQKLINLLQTHKPEIPLEICYMFYNTTAGKPDILTDPDFPESLRECVTVVI